MCIVLYTLLTTLLLIYSASVIEHYALAMVGDGGEWMIIAISWELLLDIWPILLFTAVLSSAVTTLILRRTRANADGTGQSTGGNRLGY